MTYREHGNNLRLEMNQVAIKLLDSDKINSGSEVYKEWLYAEHLLDLFMVDCSLKQINLDTEIGCEPIIFG